MNYMECEVCLKCDMRFFIVCTNGHSFCERCRKQITKRCPLCRERILPSKVEDRTRWRIISEHLDTFYKGLQVGDLIEAKDRDNRWFESRIREMDTETNKVLVHYFGWDAKWDEWLPLQYHCICPKGVHTSDEWFQNMKVRDAIEFKLHLYNRPSKWYVGVVTEIPASKRYVRVMGCKGHFKIRFTKDTLCKLVTHCVRLSRHDRAFLESFGCMV